MPKKIIGADPHIKIKKVDTILTVPSEAAMSSKI
jgi:hypothetical protein